MCNARTVTGRKWLQVLSIQTRSTASLDNQSYALSTRETPGRLTTFRKTGYFIILAMHIARRVGKNIYRHLIFGSEVAAKRRECSKLELNVGLPFKS